MASTNTDLIIKNNNIIYYFSNNCEKNTTRHLLTHNCPPTHMSYGYQDQHYNNYEYEYTNDGNHSNNGYDEYEPYSDYGEPDHWETEPKPDHYEEQECNTPYSDSMDHENGPDGYEYGNEELEHEGYELHELEEVYTDEEGYGLEEERYKNNEQGMDQYGECDKEETREQEELQRMADKWGYEPHDLKYNGSTLSTNDDEDDDNVYTPTPTYVPTNPLSSPTPIPLARDSSHSNQ
jgi:hypothetical protein